MCPYADQPQRDDDLRASHPLASVSETLEGRGFWQNEVPCGAEVPVGLISDAAIILAAL